VINQLGAGITYADFTVKTLLDDDVDKLVNGRGENPPFFLAKKGSKIGAAAEKANP
jgi:hypothetical protein